MASKCHQKETPQQTFNISRDRLKQNSRACYMWKTR